MLQAGELLAPRRDLAPVERFGGDQRFGSADRHAGFDRLRPEGREQGRENAAVLQRAERGDVEFRSAPEQREYPVTLGDPALRQDIGEPVRLRAQSRVAEIANLIVAPDPAQSELVAAAGRDVAVDRLMCHVESAAGQTVEQRPRLCPRERPGRRVVIQRG